jgi:hypothetical protein
MGAAARAAGDYARADEADRLPRFAPGRHRRAATARTLIGRKPPQVVYGRSPAEAPRGRGACTRGRPGGRDRGLG